MRIKLHNKLLKKKDYTHLIILKRELNAILLQNTFFTVEEHLQAAL
jgi:hypothetical protein